MSVGVPGSPIGFMRLIRVGILQIHLAKWDKNRKFLGGCDYKFLVVTTTEKMIKLCSKKIGL